MRGADWGSMNPFFGDFAGKLVFGEANAPGISNSILVLEGEKKKVVDIVEEKNLISSCGAQLCSQYQSNLVRFVRIQRNLY